MACRSGTRRRARTFCFVEGRDYARIVRERLGADHPIFQPGEIRDAEGRLLGRHDGLVSYTVGQRRGIGLGAEGKADLRTEAGSGATEPLHVLRLETATNTLRVGPARALGCRGLVASRLNLQAPASWIGGKADVRIRYRHQPAEADVRLEGDRLHAHFAAEQRAVAPGESCVIYRDGCVLGGGRIEGPCACAPDLSGAPATGPDDEGSRFGTPVAEGLPVDRKEPRC